jgi:hypothetical protein
MKTQHTPGKWTATETGIYGEHLNGHGNFYICALPFPSEPPTPTDAANLALIAAAPDLLAALKLCENVIGMAQLEGKLSNNALSPVQDALNAARAALDKTR